MPAYKISVIKDGSIGTAKIKKGMNVEVFCDNPNIFGTGKLLSKAFEEKYGFPIPGIDDKTIIRQCDGWGFFELKEL
jgi:hypothetical protein